MSQTVLLFPGQGAQTVGMGSALAAAFPEARAVFDAADAALGWSLSELCWEGPDDRLRLTEYAQPAILTHSVAALRVLEAQGAQWDGCAGHSLGEWTALVATSALSFSDAVQLVSARGRLMQEAAAPGVGAMAAVLGVPTARVEDLITAAKGDETLEIAAFNGAKNTVVSGHAGAVGRLVDAALAQEISAIALPVSAPFHSALMAPAQAQLSALLDATEIKPPTRPIFSTIAPEVLETPDQIRTRLVDQLVAPVRWQHCIEAILAPDGGGVGRWFAPGPGAAVVGQVKRIRRKPRVHVLSTPEDFEGLQV